LVPPVAPWREAAFLGGRLGDFGLTLLVVWWVMQVNPAIALFAATFQPDVAVATDHATVMLEAAQTGLNFLGVLLFVALLLRRREYFGVTAVLFIVAAIGGVQRQQPSAPWGTGWRLARASALRRARWRCWLRFAAAAARMIVCAVALLPRCSPPC
jgi:hypothetical protein